ncbi:TPA: hypothetical protein NEG48_001033 [Elizabethkingia anophelis]|nr:hypothetical protein [Elizabethkingia anophelis]
MKKLIKKKYIPPTIQVIKVEMEASFSSASAFMSDNGINRRWGSMGKYTEHIRK